MPTINEYVDQLKSDRIDLVDNLETKGVSGLSGDETFTELVPRVLDIEGGGQIIQYDVVPTPSIDYVGKIIQFTGTTDSTYTNGFFYKCIEDGASYSWVQVNVQESNEGQTIQYAIMPLASATNEGDIVQYIGVTDASYTNGYFYKCVEDDGNYSWENINTQASSGGQIIQYSSVPSPGADYLDHVIQYIGTTDGTYTNGYFYKCASDGAAIPTYSWERIDVQPIIPPQTYTYPGTTMAVNNLTGNWSLKAGEILSLTINNTTASDLETIMYFESGTTPTSVSMPSVITNLGDAPTMTTSGSTNSGTCEISKHYIISVINNIAIWKAY